MKKKGNNIMLFLTLYKNTVVLLRSSERMFWNINNLKGSQEVLEVFNVYFLVWL